MKEHEPIPGERDRTTDAPTEPGIVGTTGYGVDLPAGLANDPTLNDAAREQNRWEGGGRLPRSAKEQNQDDPGGNVSKDEGEAEARRAGTPPERTIAGPGAADVLASTGGEDLPGFSPGKGTSETRGESEIADPKKLVPRLGPDTEAHPGERRPDEELPGSATGTIGGGGPDAHKRSQP